MIYGIADQKDPEVPTASYSVPGAVHFDGATSLFLSSIASTNNNFLSFAGWFQTAWTGSFPTAFIFDPNNQYSPYFQKESSQVVFNVSNDGSGGWKNFGIGIDYSSPPVSASWQQIMGTIRSNGTNFAQWFFGDIDSGSAGAGDSGTFNISTNGLELWIGDDSFSDYYTGDMADFSIWPGISFLTGDSILTATRRLFIDAFGRPVDPAIAIAALGTPAIMLSGDSTTFSSNSLGSAGSLTVNAGSLTNASTIPG